MSAWVAYLSTEYYYYIIPSTLWIQCTCASPHAAVSPGGTKLDPSSILPSTTASIAGRANQPTTHRPGHGSRDTHTAPRPAAANQIAPVAHARGLGTDNDTDGAGVVRRLSACPTLLARQPRCNLAAVGFYSLPRASWPPTAANVSAALVASQLGVDRLSLLWYLGML